jgi:hypothetical protein
MATAERDTWRWGKALLACFDELRPQLIQHRPSVVDREVIPDFGGSPDRLTLWLICAKKSDVPALEREAANLRELLTEAMGHHGFPQSARDTLWLGFTSHEQIEQGGGRFAYFR